MRKKWNVWYGKTKNKVKVGEKEREWFETTLKIFLVMPVMFMVSGLQINIYLEWA
jgi:hypothetical protein